MRSGSAAGLLASARGQRRSASRLLAARAALVQSPRRSGSAAGLLASARRQRRIKRLDDLRPCFCRQETGQTARRIAQNAHVDVVYSAKGLRIQDRSWTSGA